MRHLLTSNMINKQLNFLRQATESLRAGKFRTVLSILGIAIGVAGVLGINTVSKGGHHMILTELSTFGLGSVWIRRDFNKSDPRRAVRAGTGISTSDFEALKRGCCPALLRLSPVVRQKGSPYVVHRGNRYSNADILGVGSDYSFINNDQITQGRSIQRRDVTRRRSVVMLGAHTKQELFGDLQDPVGREIRIGNHKFVVIAVIKEKNRDFLSSIGVARGLDANRQILIPYTVYNALLGNDDINWLQAEAKSPGEAPLGAEQLQKALEKRHGERFEYRTETMMEHIDTSHNILDIVYFVGLASASLALIVGGLGIVSIMSTSVLHRTREIGIRKAIGASNSDIQTQFLLEALLIGLIGGAIGLAIGLGFNVLASGIMHIPVVTSWPLLLAVLLVSVLVGLISGFYPARRASLLNPVEALRYE